MQLKLLKSNFYSLITTLKLFNLTKSGGRSRAHLVKHSRSHMTYNFGVVTESDHEIFLARKTCVFLSESQEEVRALVQQLFIANRVWKWLHF